MATSTTSKPGPKPPVYIVEGNFHAQLEQAETGELVDFVLPLKVPYKTFKKLASQSTGDGLDDIEVYVEAIGTAAARDALEGAADTIEVLAVAQLYFEKFTELADARMGELKASSGI